MQQRREFVAERLEDMGIGGRRAADIASRGTRRAEQLARTEHNARSFHHLALLHSPAAEQGAIAQQETAEAGAAAQMKLANTRGMAQRFAEAVKGADEDDPTGAGVLRRTFGEPVEKLVEAVGGDATKLPQGDQRAIAELEREKGVERGTKGDAIPVVVQGGTVSVVGISEDADKGANRGEEERD
jgi:hypothetical protein